MTDHLLRCVTCPSDFSLTDGEIEFYRGKGFVLPKRCPACRAKRRAEKAAAALTYDTAEAQRDRTAGAREQR